MSLDLLAWCQTIQCYRTYFILREAMRGTGKVQITEFLTLGEFLTGTAVHTVPISGEVL